MKSPFASLMLALSLSTSLACACARAAEPGFGQGAKLANKYNCQSCHLLDKPAAGPSFRAIAKRYASDPNAQSELETTVRNGSTGAWGPTPMPGVDVPERDLKRLVAFILSLKEY
jgi:cytochrome c551/c552